MNLSRREFLSASATGVGLVASGNISFAQQSEQAGLLQTSPFMSENYAPVREEITAEDLPIIGKLPAELSGMFVRNGPNPQFPPKLNYHWFDGDGMLHGVRLQDGMASYRNRWIRTAAWQEANQAGTAIYPSVLDPPDAQHFLNRFLNGQMPFPNTANTALVWHHGKLLALWEGGPPHEISASGLETLGPYTFGSQLKHAFTAHPKVDPRTGELIFFGYSLVPPYLQYSVADRDGNITSTTPIELPRAVMMHDFAITENYSVFIDCPGVFDPLAMLVGKPILSYQPRHGARIGVLPRHATGDKIRWFEIETCFIFHIFNAYEKGDEIVLHGCRFPTYPDFVGFDSPLKSEEYENVAKSTLPIAYSWRMNMKTGVSTEVAIDDSPSEFPRVNEGLTGSKTKFGYALSGMWQSFVKYDFDSGKKEHHELGKNEVAGEGVFVPRLDAKGEDDGWLLSFSHDRAEGRSELRVVDCMDMTGDPIARIRIPQRVPYGFHATWLPDHVL